MQTIHYWAKRLSRPLLILTAVFFTGTLFIYLHSYYLSSYFNVKSMNDPRWRIYDCNSRQATEGEIYNVAEVPAVNKVIPAGHRRFRFEFTPPIRARSWKIRTEDGRETLSMGLYPEIQFPDTFSEKTYEFIPEGVTLLKPIRIQLSFDPKERNYIPSGLSWQDNFYTRTSTVPFSHKRPYSVDDWAGIAGDDPEIIRAREILGNTISPDLPALEKSGRVFRFIMEKIKDATGCPSDSLQEASPLKTYEMMSTGRAKGWCENNALIYYLFANAVGIRTRLVERAGKFGPLKLTGHYFCESWIPEYAKWVYVDPMINVAHIKNSQARPIYYLELRKLVDVAALQTCEVTRYDKGGDSLVRVEGSGMAATLSSMLTGEMVFAYKFGYANNRSYSKIFHFLRGETLLWAPYALPHFYLWKYLFLYGLLISMALAAANGLVRLVTRE